MYGVVWSCAVFYCRYCIVLYSMNGTYGIYYILWFCMVFWNPVWSCMVLYYLMKFYIVLYGFEFYSMDLYCLLCHLFTFVHICSHLLTFVYFCSHFSHFSHFLTFVTIWVVSGWVRVVGEVKLNTNSAQLGLGLGKK